MDPKRAVEEKASALVSVLNGSQIEALIDLLRAISCVAAASGDDTNIQALMSDLAHYVQSAGCFDIVNNVSLSRVYVPENGRAQRELSDSLYAMSEIGPASDEASNQQDNLSWAGVDMDFEGVNFDDLVAANEQVATAVVTRNDQQGFLGPEAAHEAPVAQDDIKMLLSLLDSSNPEDLFPDAPDANVSFAWPPREALPYTQIPPLPSIQGGEELADEQIGDYQQGSIFLGAHYTSEKDDNVVVDLIGDSSLGSPDSMPTFPMEDDSTPATDKEAQFPSPGFTEALYQTLVALENENLSDVSFTWIADTHNFRYPWGVFGGSFTRTLLEQLVRPHESEGDETVKYFIRKRAVSQSTAGCCMYFRRELGEMRQIAERVLTVIGGSKDWSLVEAHPRRGWLTHYTCSSDSPSTAQSHRACDHCNYISEHLSLLLRQVGEPVPFWRKKTQDVPPWTTSDSLWLLWLTRTWSDTLDLAQPMPAKYELMLAQEVLGDIKAVYSSQMMLGTDMIASPVQPGDLYGALESFWIDFGSQNGFGRRLWERLGQLAAKPTLKTNETVGLSRASELLQLTVSIASPEVFLSIKNCLAVLRSQPAAHSVIFPETPRGSFDALLSHTNHSQLSSIGVRLGQWKLYQMKKELGGDLEQSILSGGSSTAQVTLNLITDILKQNRQGAYWAHVVDYVGDRDPNILCLLPRTGSDNMGVQSGPGALRRVQT
ncbi:uncharacterized protein LDX57_008656 [Aspergillus melleus]|uniref:uncharacterized protein n=1 Tax=Aspergillus melleus TaxID=138277 RepID=UPI001E8E4E85|nr:uncharacterized protein LDX57_008656 [Aspergillus melleus]KAH8430995.1 hypothetical protein LDX57_008656 [Aspergillus melleus]